MTKTASRGKSVYGRAGGWPVLAPLALVAALLAALPAAVSAAPAAGTDRAGTVLDAREALRKHDRNRLAALRAQALAEANPLALWVDYWELSNRLNEAQQAELDDVRRSAGAAPTSRIACATTGCSSSAGAATGPTSPPSSRAFA